jgi:anti-sigma factor RsiW
MNTPHREPAELAALADGSLAAARRAALEAEVAASPELAERLAEQQRAVVLARSAAATIQAPAALRARIEAQRRPRRRVPRVALTAAAAGGVAAGLVRARPTPPGARLHAELAATRLAPDASGAATLTRTAAGWRVVLEARGLRLLAGGRFYEAWLRDRDGVLVPIGTFNQGPKATLWAGVSPKRFTTLTVTRETADNTQGSSGETVLAGSIETRDQAPR